MTVNATPLVSIVIPTYNHARFLGRALQSVLDQTYTHWEVIVIDNHSTDNTDEVVASFTDPRITYLKIHNNGVIAASRNAGINAAKGEWIAFLDSDDWWTKDKLQACFNCITVNVDLVYHDMEIVSNKKRLFIRKKIESWQVKNPVTIDLMVRGNAIVTSSVLVRTHLLRALNGMNESLDMVATEDYNTWLRLGLLTSKFKYISKRLGFYQLHSQGTSRKDMSIPARNALAEFNDLLSLQQKKYIEAQLSYLKGRFNYLTRNTAVARPNLFYSLNHGTLAIKLKSALMLVSCYIV
jgi:glycosyltransferase involved in cell wall biosynthesis